MAVIMIIVRVELWSAITGAKTELARMCIVNDGTGTAARRNYFGKTFRGRSTAQLEPEVLRFLRRRQCRNCTAWGKIAEAWVTLLDGAVIEARRCRVRDGKLTKEDTGCGAWTQRCP